DDLVTGVQTCALPIYKGSFDLCRPADGPSDTGRMIIWLDIQMNRHEVFKIIAAHQGKLAKDFGVKSLALFGSVARNEATVASDRSEERRVGNERRCCR